MRKFIALRLKTFKLIKMQRKFPVILNTMKHKVSYRVKILIQ